MAYYLSVSCLSNKELYILDYILYIRVICLLILNSSLKSQDLYVGNSDPSLCTKTKNDDTNADPLCSYSSPCST